MSKFEYGKKEKEEVKPEEVNAVKDLQEAALEKAKKCLHSELFKDLLGGYKKAERGAIDLLLRLSKEEHDPQKFGYIAKDILQNLAHIKAMIDIVHKGGGERYADD